MDYGPLGSSVHGILQSRILECVAMPSSKGFPDVEIKPMFLMSAVLADRFFTTSANTVIKGGEILETFHCD